MTREFNREDAHVVMRTLGIARPHEQVLEALRLAELNRARRATGPEDPDAAAPARRADAAELRDGEYAIEVSQWHDTPDGSGPPRAVAVTVPFRAREGERIIEGKSTARLWTPAAVDELIALLQRHRMDVWPMSAE